MKKQIDAQFLATILGGVIFNYLFWMERLALNLLIYSIFILTMLFFDQKLIKNKKIIWAGFSHLLAACLVVFNNSDLNVITWYISLIVFIGFTHFPSLRTIIFAIMAGALQGIAAPLSLASKFQNIKVGNFSIRILFKPIKYIILPLCLIIVFSFLYSSANSTFANYFDWVLTNIGDFIANVFNFFFADLNFWRLMHVILGILVTGALLIAYKDEYLTKCEDSFLIKLVRKRRVKKVMMNNGQSINARPTKKKMGLKTEATVGIISFVALNFLILCLNLIDISNLWIKKTVSSNFNYSAELHEGTNALIWSIVIAMCVILYFFRGNLNFYSKNKMIRLLAYIWIAQNTFLICSVFLRDYHYIDTNGLTYKRIGVLIFLLLSIIGLITVYLKVKQQKTFFFLLKINGFIWYCLLLTFGFINWDVFIVSYNIHRQAEITLDINHLMSMSDKTIPLLDSNRALLIAHSTTSNTSEGINNYIDWKIEKFRLRRKKTSWLSWNYRDWQTLKYLDPTLSNAKLSSPSRPTKPDSNGNFLEHSSLNSKLK